MKNKILKNIMKVRNSLLAFANKKFLIFLFFLFLSTIFWLSIALNEIVEKEISVPIRLANVPQNAVITTPLPDTVRVTLRDKGFALLPYLYGDKLHSIAVNFSTYANKNGYIGQVPNSDIQKCILQSLYASTQITSIKPDKFEFYYNYGLSKKVSIRLKGTIRTASGYYLSQVRFYPERVTIYASKHLLDSIVHIYTKPLHITNMVDTIQQTVELQTIKGVKIVPNTVKLTLYPDILTEEAIEVPITAVNMPQGKVLRTFPSRVKVLYSVGASRYRTVSANGFRVEVDYNEMQKNPSDKCTIVLKTFPLNISNARLETNQVDYLIEQQ